MNRDIRARIDTCILPAMKDRGVKKYSRQQQRLNTIFLFDYFSVRPRLWLVATEKHCVNRESNSTVPHPSSLGSFFGNGGRTSYLTE